MKKTGVLFFFIFSTVLAIGQNLSNYKLIVFSGSDWCKPCIRLKTETLNNDDLIALFTEHKIEKKIADFPRRKANKPDQAVVKENEELAELYNKEGAFPKLVLLDNNNQVLYTKMGYIEANALIKELNSISLK